MTTVRYEYDKNTRKIEISGHADYDEIGRDIVCAGITALARTYEAYLRQLGDGKATIDSLLITEGHFKLYSTVKSPEAIAAFEMLIKGLQLISENYPDNLKIF